MIAVTAIDLYRPLLYKELFDQLAVTDSKVLAPLIHTLLLILGFGAIHRLLWQLFGYTNNFFQIRVKSDLLNTCYEYLQQHSYNFFSNSFVGSLVTRVKRFERSFEDIADQLYLELGRTILIIASIMVVLFIRDLTLGLIVFVWAILFVGFALGFSRYKLKYDLLRAEADTKTTAQLADTITNNINLKIFTGYKKEFSAFRGITDYLFKIRKKSWDLGAHGDFVQGVLVILLEFGVLYYALIMWQRGLFTIGDFALIQAYLGRIFEKLWGAGKHIRIIYESMADANEMTEMLMRPHEVQDVPDAKQLKVSRGALEFQAVTFQYHSDKAIFKNFNFSINSGERVALVGPSGGGKSTIIKLLLRFHDISKGQIKIDGQDISQVTQESLRRSMAFVPQDPILFHRSLYENIRYGRPSASRDEVLQAAKLAHCHEFILNSRDKYDTLVGERGIKLSGGERQRVAIARAILKNAPILVLDEATSSLDSESEKLIQDALRNLMQNRTTIVIAHRLSTIMQMDRIVVIEKGKIVEQGKHEELVKARQGIYQKLWEIQAGGFA